MLENNYTALSDSKINRKIDSDLFIITQSIFKRLCGKISCILLGGGFGRGEGTVTLHPEIQIENDYDIFVFSDERIPPKTGNELEKELTDLLNVPHVDVLLCNINKIKPSQFMYDVRFGSILLWGEFPESCKKFKKRIYQLCRMP